jgi:hypothetical protein
VLDTHDAPAPVRFHHLCVEQFGQRHPPRLGAGDLCPGAVQVASTDQNGSEGLWSR